jgi:hypothetical protein
MPDRQTDNIWLRALIVTENLAQQAPVIKKDYLSEILWYYEAMRFNQYKEFRRVLLRYIPKETRT